MSDDYKSEFEQLFTTHIKREGADKLLAFIKTTDFFEAPASTRFHSNFAGGLTEHSVKVFKRFTKILESEYGKDHITETVLESAAIIALLHDLCKTNCYKVEMRNVKVGGEWEKKPYYTFEDPLPYGHGEKSVYMISGYMRLTREEAMAINWHMGGFDSRNLDGKYTISGAFTQFPLALLFHTADLLTTYLDEKTVK